MSADQDILPSREPADAPGRRLRFWVPALMMALIVGALWAPNLMRPPPPAWTIYASLKGQIRRVILADKSVLRLNGASQVRVVYEDDNRRAAIGQAEAAFTIMPSARRPFVIAAGDRVIEMRSGEINLLRQTTQRSAKTVLTILEGTARIYPQDRAAEGVDGAPDQEISWTDGEAKATVRTVNAANAFAWESHRLAYDKAPLSEVIADLNRYVARPIRIADPTLGSLPYTGVLTLQGEDLMLRKIAAALPVEAKALPAEIVLQRPTPKPVKRKPNALVQSLLTLNRPKPKPPAKTPPAP